MGAENGRTTEPRRVAIKPKIREDATVQAQYRLPVEYIARDEGIKS